MSRARSRSRTLCSFEPVKWIRCVPACSGRMTMRSTCGPRPPSRTAALCGPRPMTVSTDGSVANVSTTRSGSSVSARRSRSPIVSRRRRYEPAGTIRPVAEHRSQRGRRARRRAASPGSGASAGRCARAAAMPSRISCSVRSDRPRRSGPGATPRAGLQVVDGLDAELLVDQPDRLRPDARQPQHLEQARRELREQLLAVLAASGRRELARAGSPSTCRRPGSPAACPRDTPRDTSTGDRPIASAARWYATVLNTSSPLTSSRSPMSWNTCASWPFVRSGTSAPDPPAPPHGCRAPAVAALARPARLLVDWLVGSSITRMVSSAAQLRPDRHPGIGRHAATLRGNARPIEREGQLRRRVGGDEQPSR